MASNYKNTNLYAPASSQPYKLEIYFNETEVNNVDNYSKIFIKGTLSATNVSYSSTDGGTLRIYWHDNRENYDRLVATSVIHSCGMSFGSRSVEGTINAYHNNDGNLNGYAFATFTKNKTTTWIPNSGSVYTDSTILTYIARKAIVTRFDNFNDEQNPTIYFNNPGNFKMNAYLEFAGVNIARGNIPNTGSYTFELTEAERNLIRSKSANSNTMSIRGVIATAIGQETENYWSFLDRTISIVNANPTFEINSINYIDINPETVNVTNNNQMIVQNVSKLRIISKKAVPKKNANIIRYDVTFNNQTISYTNVNNFGIIDFNQINSSQSSKVVISAIDSRGNSVTVDKNVYIEAWELPKISYKANRINNFENSTKVKIDVDISNVGNTNTINSIICKYKKTSDIDFTNQVILENNVSKIINLDNLYSWNLQIEVNDKFGKKIINDIIPIGKPIMFFDIDMLSVGVGDFPTNINSFDAKIINGLPSLTYEVLEEWEE